MNHPRILVVTRWFPSEDAPTEGSFLSDWVKVMERFGRVQVLHLQRGGPAPIRTEEWLPSDGRSIRVHRLPIAWRGVRHPLKELTDVRRSASAVEALNTSDGPFDLLHAHAYIAGVAVRRASEKLDIPYMLTEHFTRLIRGDARWYHLAQARYAYRGAARLTAVGPALAARVRDLAGRRTEVVPNPVAATFQATPPPPASGAPKLLSVGGVRPIKGYDVLLDALAQLRNAGAPFTWTLVGDGPAMPELRRLSHELGVDDLVQFLGTRARVEVAAQMENAHIVVVPSRHETFSVVAAEALMCGRPVVATRSGGPEAFIDETNGRVIPAEDPSALANAIADTARDYWRYDHEGISQGARRCFSVEAVCSTIAPIAHPLL